MSNFIKGLISEMACNFKTDFIVDVFPGFPEDFITVWVKVLLHGINLFGSEVCFILLILGASLFGVFVWVQRVGE
jgi:hypothetical protein